MTKPPSAPGERTKLARKEGRRLAKERGVPLVETRTPESRDLFGRYGIPCTLQCRVSPFGVCPAGYYDDNGVLRAVVVPRLLTRAQKRKMAERAAAARPGTGLGGTNAYHTAAHNKALDTAMALMRSAIGAKSCAVAARHYRGAVYLLGERDAGLKALSPRAAADQHLVSVVQDERARPLIAQTERHLTKLCATETPVALRLGLAS